MIVVGAGAGGSTAAAFLRRAGADFVWYEAGPDESDRLRQNPASSAESMPTQLWTPTPLRLRDGTPLPYMIPKSAGGMTTHYEGVQYWTEVDIVASLQLEENELEALEFVRNVTNAQVHCDVFDPRYHTHARHPTAPAPSQREMTALPMCMYGRCESNDAQRDCPLNQAFLAKVGLTSASVNWHRNSAFVEYGEGGDELSTEHWVVSLQVHTGRVTGVHVSDGTHTTLTCARHAVLLAGGVMGNAPLLLPHIGPYHFFAQPVVVYTDSKLVSKEEVCDGQSLSGGTFHRLHNGTGFLSTFGMCTVHGVKRLVWATPQAINPLVEGVIDIVDDVATATVNFDDPSIRATLLEDVATTARLSPWEIDLDLGDLDFQHAGYHWTGDASVVHRSRVRGMRALYAADAMGVVGPTSGWTSFNARVAGAAAALRALRRTNDACLSIKVDYQTRGCCQTPASQTCETLHHEFQTETCCG